MAYDDDGAPTPMNDSGTAAAIESGRRSADVNRRLVVFEGVPVVAGADGGAAVAKDLLAELDARRPTPVRRKGTATLAELESFVEHVNRFKGPATVAFADVARFRVAAIFDYNPAGSASERDGDKLAGWMEHRAVYVCPRSPEWVAWTERDGRPMTQTEFADFVEARLEDLRSGSKDDYPKPVDVLAMARNLMVRTSGTFQRTIDPTTGTGTLIAKTEHGAESTKIHRAFLLGLRVFEGGELYAVEARVRFSLVEGRPAFSYQLYRRAELERDAFADVRAKVAEGTQVPVYAGAAES